MRTASWFDINASIANLAREYLVAAAIELRASAAVYSIDYRIGDNCRADLADVDHDAGDADGAGNLNRFTSADEKLRLKSYWNTSSVSPFACVTC